VHRIGFLRTRTRWLFELLRSRDPLRQEWLAPTGHQQLCFYPSIHLSCRSRCRSVDWSKVVNQQQVSFWQARWWPASWRRAIRKRVLYRAWTL